MADPDRGSDPQANELIQINTGDVIRVNEILSVRYWPPTTFDPDVHRVDVVTKSCGHWEIYLGSSASEAVIARDDLIAKIRAVTPS